MRTNCLTSLPCCLLILIVIMQDSSLGRLRHAPSWAKDSSCERCPPGHGAERRCLPGGQPTVCKPCVLDDSYSGHHSYKQPCIPCSRCGPGLFEAHPCSLTSDTVCDSCHTFRVPADNQDYIRKCMSPTTQSHKAYQAYDWLTNQSTNASNLGTTESAINFTDDDSHKAEARSWKMVGVGIALLLGAIALAALALRMTAWVHSQVTYTRFQNVDILPTTV